MATPDELRASLAEGRANFRSALEAFPAAKWETPPAPSEGNDEPWSPRTIAEHLIGRERFFTTAICEACGYPGVDVAELQLAGPAEAIAAYDEGIELTNKKLKYLTETDLPKAHERFGTSERMMGILINHANEHAAELNRIAAQ